MNVTLAAALLLQATGIVLLRHRLGRMWLRRPVVILYLASVVYQGVSAVLLSIPSLAAQDATLRGIAPGFTGNAALLTSAVMFAVLIAYLLTRPQQAPAISAVPVRDLAAALDWRLAASACLPLAWLTYEGRGYNSAIASGAPIPLGTNLAVTFFVLLVPAGTCGFVIRHGLRWFLPALLTQSLLLAAAGERTPVLTGAIALALMLAFAGMRPRARQIIAATGIAVLAVLAITGVRAQQGRTVFTSASGLTARAQALASGVTGTGTPSGEQPQPGLISQAATRLDGNSFTAGILQAQHMGYSPMSPVAIPESLLIAVPSALWPSKLSRGYALDPFPAQIVGFGLQNINFLPTFPGLYAGFLPWPWLIALMAVLGAAFGWAERWLLRAVTPARLVLLAGAVTAALHYEAGLPAMLVDLRAAAIIAAGVKGIEVARSRRRAPVPGAVTLPLQ